MGTFTYEGNKFYYDGKEFSLRSGAMHYFRIPECYWYDRLLKLKECGFNCVETYIAWNLHEKKEGEYDFYGALDVGKFLDIAKSLGLFAIVRPGPYICAEWDGGGLPHWLFSGRRTKIRCNDTLFLERTKRYLNRVFQVIRPRLVTRGGNVLMVQVENEYGSYGNDKQYLKELVDFHKENGVDCLLFASDGASSLFYEGGKTEGCLHFFNFGSNVEQQMSFYEKTGLCQPRVCAEFWAGWFDHWGEEHHTRPVSEVVENIEIFLKNGWGFNVYMFHGGTNFGFWNGCNYSDELGIRPTVTSYDYCAPLSEAGDRTPGYYAIRDLFIRYGADVPEITAKETEKRAYGKVEFTCAALLFSNLARIGVMKESLTPLTMEECGQGQGYILYQTQLCKDISGSKLTFENLGDRAVVFLDEVQVGVYQHLKCKEKLSISTKKPAILSVLVENQGRINYGCRIADVKGLTDVCVEQQRQFGWKNFSLPMDDLDKLAYAPIHEVNDFAEKPAFFKGYFQVDVPADSFLRIDGFCRGFVLVNGFNLGRYDKTGPQKTLFLPKNLLKEGQNELVVFDSDGALRLDAELVSVPDLGGKGV